MKEVINVKIFILVDDRIATFRKRLTAEHGISVLIKTIDSDNNMHNILFDTGTSGFVLANNAKEMKLIEKEKMNVELIVLSHKHYDHTGGLSYLIEKSLINEVPVVCHPECLKKAFVFEPKAFMISAPHKVVKYVEENGILTKRPIEISPGVMFLGEIKRVFPEEKITLRSYTFTEDGLPKLDELRDDSALAINVKNKGLVIITGCSHSGIINIINDAINKTGVEEIYMVLGVFHLIGADDKRISWTIRKFQEYNVKYVAPCHCTGLRAMSEFYTKMASKFIEIGVGSVLKIPIEI